ncbi:MAG TPA: radical SAM protein [Ignavibacteriaceae bacterium]|nr:radical SAM protein [Ignavibacteriaceae bacterium]
MPCNQKCIMCLPEGSHSKETLPYEKFLQFFEKIKPYAEHLTIIEEPLMYPWINEVLQLLAEHTIEVSINTNATLLNERMCQKLLSLHALNLRCSIDAATPEMYLKIRGKDQYHHVKKNLERFSFLVKGKSNMRQIFIYVVMKENLCEVLQFIDFVKPMLPHRIEFHPVRHVKSWVVENNTGWLFNGMEQSCEFIKEEYNEIMKLAEEKCRQEEINYEILPL